MSARKRHVPLRSCVGCREKNSKRGMLRVVADRNNGVTFDASGTLSGRGAYLCPACAAAVDGIRKNRLEHTLRTKIDDTEWDKVIRDLKAYANTPENRQCVVHDGGAND